MKLIASGVTFSAARGSEFFLVLAVFVVDHHNHAAGPNFLNRIWDVSKGQLGAHIEPILAEEIIPKQRSMRSTLVVAKCFHRVDACRPPRRDVPRDYRHQQQRDRHSEISWQVPRRGRKQ